jgi:hypothetical protein
VIDVALTTVTFVAETPAPAILTVAGLTKFVPVSVTFTDAPCAPEDGPILDSVGVFGAAEMVNALAPLVPPTVLTVRLRAPAAAPLAIVNEAVIWLALELSTVAVTPVPETATVPFVRFEPEMLTGTVAPGAPEFGVTAVMLGRRAKAQ